MVYAKRDFWFEISSFLESHYNTNKYQGLNMTVKESIINILNKNINNKLSANEITQLIIKNNLYDFKKAKYPTKVVGSELSKLIKKKEYSLYVDKNKKPFMYYLTKGLK